MIFWAWILVNSHCFALQMSAQCKDTTPNFSCPRAHCSSLFLTKEPVCMGTRQCPLSGLEDRVRQRDAVSHHGRIKTILGHPAAACPTLFSLPQLGPSILKPDLVWGRRRHCDKDAWKCLWARSSKMGQLSFLIEPRPFGNCTHHLLKTHRDSSLWVWPISTEVFHGIRMTKIKSKYSFPHCVKESTVMLPGFSHRV